MSHDESGKWLRFPMTCSGLAVSRCTSLMPQLARVGKIAGSVHVCSEDCDLSGGGAAAVSPRRPSVAGDRDAPSCLEFNGSEQKAAK